jgi:pilus assembly protein CpaE
MGSPLRTVIVDSDVESRAALRRLASTLSSVVIVGEFGTTDEAAGAARTLHPDVVIADTSAESAQPVERLAQAVPDAAILATVPIVSTSFVLQLMRAGAFEILSRPVQRPDLLAALDKLTRFRRGVAPQRRAGRIIALFSTKGGLGATTLAVNLGVCLAEGAAGDTLLIELNTWHSDAATFLDLRPRYSVIDALDNVERIDESFLKGLLVKHASGLWALTAPSRNESIRLNREAVQAGLELIRSHFDHVILDLRHDLDDGTTAALELADTILLLTTANISALRLGTATLATFRQLGLDLTKVRAVLMRDGTGEDVTARHASEALGLPIFWKIPNEYRAVVEAINTGRPVVTASPRSKLAKNVRELADTLPSTPKPPDAAPKRRDALFRLAWPAKRFSGAG